MTIIGLVLIQNIWKEVSGLLQFNFFIRYTRTNISRNFWCRRFNLFLTWLSWVWSWPIIWINIFGAVVLTHVPSLFINGLHLQFEVICDEVPIIRLAEAFLFFKVDRILKTHVNMHDIWDTSFGASLKMGREESWSISFTSDDFRRNITDYLSYENLEENDGVLDIYHQL